MTRFVLSLLSIFPASFFFFAISQRLRARHESRVGRQITFPDFFRQLWVDELVELRSIKTRRKWLLFFVQVSILFLFQIDAEYLVFIYLAVNGFLLSCCGKFETSVSEKIRADRFQVSFAIATLIAILCVFGCFTVSGSASLANIKWSWISLLFVVPFQLSGMILFSEAPFAGMETGAACWLRSARFYVWSIFCVQLFLAGGDSFVLTHVKAGLLYLVFRAIGFYFPNYQQKDLLRISILYLFPVTGIVWLLAMLLFGVIESGVVNV